jgi:hypothetical protein
MKKLLNYALAFAAGSFLLSSCASDDIDENTPRPTLDITELAVGITNGEVIVAPGTTLAFRWNAIQAGGGSALDKFEIRQSGVNTTTPLPLTAGGRIIPLESFPSSIRTQYIDTLFLNAGLNLGITTYTFIVTDRNGLKAEREIRVEVKNVGTPFGAEITGQFFHIGGSLQGSYNLVTSQNVSSTAANEGVRDISNTDAIGNPFTGSWDAKNTTRFVKANNFDYANGTVEDAIAAFNAGTGSAAVNGPVAGDIYIARLRGSNDYAVIKVVNIDPNNNDCNCGNRGKLIFDYKKS